jgi:hypothetical protein
LAVSDTGDIKVLCQFLQEKKSDVMLTW